MKKKILSIVLAVVMLLSCLPLTLITVSASGASDDLTFASITFVGYKGWCDADNGGQERYNQRGNALPLAEGNKAVVSGEVSSDKGGTVSFKALSYQTANYYPEIYLASDGHLYRDNTYDNQNVDVNKSDYLAKNISGHSASTYGTYYGYFKLELSALSKVDTFRVYNKNNNWHLNGGFDVLYSADGTIWTKAATYTGMTSSANWDGTETIDDSSCYYKDVDLGGAEAKYLAVAVTTPGSADSQCALWYAKATGESSKLSFSSVTFRAYKAWKSADNKTRRGESLTLQEGNASIVSCASDKGGTVSFKAISYSMASYFPALYLDDNGEFVRDSRYDGVDQTINVSTYLTEGYGKYYGVFILKLSSLSEVNTFIVYNMNNGWHLTGGFDVFYSIGGTTWEKHSEYTGMTSSSKWDGTKTVDDKSCYYKTIDMGGVRAQYLAVAITTLSTNDNQCALWYAEATGWAVDQSLVPFTSLSLESYKTFKAASNKDRRTEALTIEEGNLALYDSGFITTSVAKEKFSGGNSFRVISYTTENYYPSLYLTSSGELVRDSRYDGVDQTIDVSTYLTEGYGKYYGVYKLKFESPILLDTLKFWNQNNAWHLNGSFDILYSMDGGTWTVAKSYSGMNTASGYTTVANKWDGSETYDTKTCYYKTVDMGGVEAWYVAFAISEPPQYHQCALWYAEATGRDAEIDMTELHAYSVAGLKNMIDYANGNPGTTVKLENDLVCGTSTIFPNLTAANTVIDGQGHIIYNLRNQFVQNITAAGVQVKNFTISNKQSAGGAEMSLRNAVRLIDAISGGTSANPVVIENLRIERNVANVNDMGGQFARQVSNYVTFKDCTNVGNYIGSNATDMNVKIGGFVGCVNTGANVTFLNCVNEGNISGSQAGGLVGVFGEGGVTITMTNCSNNGTITGFASGTSNKQFGVAGGLIGGVNNSSTVTGDTYITMTGCTNHGDVVLYGIDSNSKSAVLGGLIGHAGGVASEYDTTTVYQITLDNCGVHGCAIDATATNCNGDTIAAAFVGRISPQKDSNVAVLAKNCYVSDVEISATNARKFVGVAGNFEVQVVTAENCMVHKFNEVNSSDVGIVWNDDSVKGCRRIFTAASSSKTGFADTDTDNLITGGGVPQMQTSGTSSVRFVATLPAGISLDTYSKVGFYIVALTAGATSGQSNKVWIVETEHVYTGINVSGTVTAASSICSGAAYVFALEVNGIPSNLGDVTFYVTPFMIERVSGRIIFGATGATNPAINTGSDTSVPITLMSYNLKDGQYNDKSAQNRKSSLANNIKSVNASIVCLQELGSSKDSYHFTLSNNFASLCSNRSYAYVQAGKTGIMWDSTLYTKVTNGSVDCMVSTANGGDSYSRVCTWVKLRRNADSETFIVVSAHFDLNKPNLSLETLEAYMKSNSNFKGVRTIVAGDFNAEESRKSVHSKFFYMDYTNANTAYTNVIANNANLRDDDGWSSSDGTASSYGLTPTFPTHGTIIDWCYFTSTGFTVNSFSVVTGAGTSASDHYPISVSLNIRR